MTTRFGREVIFRATKPLLFFQPRFRTYRKSSELFSRTHQLTNSAPTIVWDVLLFRPLFAAYQPVVQDSKKKNSVQRPQPSIHHIIADWRKFTKYQGVSLSLPCEKKAWSLTRRRSVQRRKLLRRLSQRDIGRARNTSDGRARGRSDHTRAWTSTLTGRSRVTIEGSPRSTQSTCAHGAQAP